MTEIYLDNVTNSLHRYRKDRDVLFDLECSRDRVSIDDSSLLQLAHYSHIVPQYENNKLELQIISIDCTLGRTIDPDTNNTPKYIRESMHVM